MGQRHIFMTAVLIITLLAAGCSPIPPETVIVKETVISEVPITVEVTTVPEIVQETVVPVTEVTIPRTETITLHSSAGDRDYEIYIALPEGYAFGHLSYPVVYMLDGDLTFIWATAYSRWLSSGDIIPKLIIVGINNSHRRYQDLYPDEGGDSEKFLTFMRDELVPYIDDNYNTKPENRTLAGISDSALFSLYALFNATETFNHYIITTPSLSKDDLIFEFENEYADNHTDLPVKLFLSRGGNEVSNNFLALFERLEGRNYAGLEMNMEILENHGHVTTIVQGFIDGLQTIFHR
ncbi:MAG: alpha/beta hydrolase [Anaerolineae bacterium]|nr:alpha/beta hydrolase [Anaerolineae bacterium]